MCVGEGCSVNEANVVHYWHIALAALTGFLFATHLPERLAPGSFDYIGTTIIGPWLFKLSIIKSENMPMAVNPNLHYCVFVHP